MSEIEFSIIGTGKIPSPFNQQKTTEVSNFVFHISNAEINNDEKCHIYIDEVRCLTKHIVAYISTCRELTDYPKKLYVIYSDDIDNNEKLETFLYENAYIEEDEIRDEKKIGDSYQKFASKSHYLKNGTLQNYIAVLFNSIGIEEEALKYVSGYIGNFHVAVTSSDTKISNAENYELLESYGDHAAWKTMTEIFLTYMKQNNLEMKESVITSMHRSFASKVVQAKICREINLFEFIATKEEKTVSVCEDVFEAFTGALFYTDFLIRAYTGKYFELGEKFLRWCFSSVDLSSFEEKPEITQFHEYMKILIGPRHFTEKKSKGQCFMIVEKTAKEKLKIALPNVTEEIIEKFLKDVKVPYPSDSEDSNERRRDKYSKINNFIIENFGDESFFIKLKNEGFTKTWKDDVKEKFTEISKRFGEVIIDKRFFDKSQANYYWVLQNKEKKDIFSTMNYSDSENPDTLISVMEEKISEIQKVEVSVKQYSGRGNFYLQNGEKFCIDGDKHNVEEFLKDKLLDKKNKYFLYVNNDTAEEIFIEYSPYHQIVFDPDFDIEYVRSLLPNRNSTEFPKPIYKYIGDRMSYGQLSLIAIKKFKIKDDHTMSTIKNFFRSKNLKDEFSRMINIKDKEGNLIHYDELLGMNYDTAHLVIEYIHMKMNFPNSIIKNPCKVLTKLAEAISEKKHKSFQDITICRDEYVYRDTSGRRLSVKIEGHNYNQIKNCFAEYLILREKKNYPNWNNCINSRYSSYPKYQDLESLLRQKAVTEWEITLERNEKILSVTFEINSKLYCFKSIGANGFSSIVKQISESLGI